MEQPVHLSSRFARSTCGATSIEYSLIAALIFMALIVSVTMVGTELSAIFTTVETKFKEANS